MEEKMAELTYGQLDSWDDAKVSGASDFMKLELGSNEVRIFTNPYQFVVHWESDASGTTRKIKCALENCPLCKKGSKAQYRWYLGVINRKTNQAEILEVSSQILNGIKSLVNNPKWGDVKMYDIDIKRGKAKSNPLYSVMPDPNKGPLTESEQAMVKEFSDMSNLTKLIQPSTPEEILEKMGVSSNEGGNARYAVGNQTVTNTGTANKPNVSADDFNFGDDDI